MARGQRAIAVPTPAFAPGKRAVPVSGWGVRRGRPLAAHPVARQGSCAVGSWGAAYVTVTGAKKGRPPPDVVHVAYPLADQPAWTAFVAWRLQPGDLLLEKTPFGLTD